MSLRLLASFPDFQMPARPTVVFVLGGPGAGKGTQCKKIVSEYGFVHLSAGALLRAERKRSNSDVGAMISSYIKEGKMVPAAVAVGLIKKAMQQGMEEGNQRFLLDGFPRNHDNLQGWNNIMADLADVRFTLFLDCPRQTMEKRLLARNEGRSDDTTASFRKRFQTFEMQTRPIIEFFHKEGKLRKVDSDRPIADTFQEVEKHLAEFKQPSQAPEEAEEAEEEEEDESEDWKAQCFHWRGTLDEAKQVWTGTWVGSFKHPSREPNGQAFSASPNAFKLVQANHRSKGSGRWKGRYLMDGDYYKDKKHEIFFQPQPQPHPHAMQEGQSQTPGLDVSGVVKVVAKGDTEFGQFVSAGHFSPSSGLFHLTRRYVDDGDARLGKPLATLLTLHATLTDYKFSGEGESEGRGAAKKRKT